MVKDLSKDEILRFAQDDEREKDEMPK